jgi:membrane associated rhomboid family serine protease
MFFPYGTDAPVYHWPFATVGLIVVNALVFCAEVASPGQVEPWLLAFGDGLHPVQWISAAFLHANIWHLVGNMLFLWTFGLIVEGKLGWYRMLATYLAIAAAQGAIVQIIMLGSHGAALGASGAIFGLMAISLIWAPENNIDCFMLIVFRPFDFQVKVLVMVGLYLSLELVTAFCTNMAMGTAVLHLLGALVGFPVGIALLKWDMVDCEHWDVFSVCAGRNTMSDLERAEEEEKKPARVKQRAEADRQRRESSLGQICEILASGQPLFAFKAHERMAQKMPDWSLPEATLLAIIQAMHEKKLWTESIPAMVEYLSQHADSPKASLVRLKLGQILVVEQRRPVQAMRVMARIDPGSLSTDQHAFLEKLRVKARQLHSQDPYEVAVHDW